MSETFAVYVPDRPDNLRRVRDRDGDYWSLCEDSRWVIEPVNHSDSGDWPWDMLVFEYGPLTRADEGES